MGRYKFPNAHGPLNLINEAKIISLMAERGNKNSNLREKREKK